MEKEELMKVRALNLLLHTKLENEKISDIERSR
jgi:hypothetical protein